MAQLQQLILASTSDYRKLLLQRLHIPFQDISPAIDETPLVGESAPRQVKRLSEEKARAVAELQPEAVIIGSDQVAILDGEVLYKPGTHDKAQLQLRRMRGNTVDFYTGLCVLNARTGKVQIDAVLVRVGFRNYSDTEIERYLRIEKPYDCAGSFKSEQLGIVLVDSMQGADPTALIGLPLIRLSEMLRTEGYELP